MRSHKLTALVAAAASALALTACGGGQDGSEAGQDGEVTLTWWHNGTSDPLLGLYQKVAEDYMAATPGVKIDVQAIQEEDFKNKLPVALQGDDYPDIYHNQGGGNLASEVESGHVADLTEATSSWLGELGSAPDGWILDGKVYGVPISLHAVGFWYNIELFEQAGISQTPTTFSEFETVIDKLKAAGVAPIALGGKDRWPDAFYYNFFAIRNCSVDVLKTSLAAGQLEDACFVKAGQDTLDFIASEPFQEGFNGTPAQQGIGSSAGMVADGKAAMELQGDWDLSVMMALATDPDFESKIGWFPFPAIEGAPGDPTATQGGGDGFSCTDRQVAECADFLKYLASLEVQEQLLSSGAASIPARGEAASVLDKPVMKAISDFNAKAGYVQTYFDISLSTAKGQALDDAVANLFAGQGDAGSVAKAVNETE
ncbi:MAG: extracellular solute-binding protein [Bifidobacteriaceae bacterium]|jgi:raffinose/stachyose/melibiose transport system substrate-binding protein|nr:extracellular solute-binding protein [Bifidobacteriaceae bacterium]